MGTPFGDHIGQRHSIRQSHQIFCTKIPITSGSVATTHRQMEWLNGLTTMYDKSRSRQQMTINPVGLRLCSPSFGQNASRSDNVLVACHILLLLVLIPSFLSTSSKRHTYSRPRILFCPPWTSLRGMLLLYRNVLKMSKHHAPRSTLRGLKLRNASSVITLLPSETLTSSLVTWYSYGTLRSRSHSIERSLAHPYTATLTLFPTW